MRTRLSARLAVFGLIASFLTAVPIASASAAESTGTAITYTLEGCRASTDAYLPGTFICPDAAYTTGNLGGGWNEFDLVPGRVTLDAGQNAPANQTYSFVIAVDNCSTGDGATDCSGFPGYDRLSVPVLNTSLSSGDCGTINVSSPQFASPGIGGTGTTLYREVTVTGQDPGSECIYDFFARLAFDSHLYPGSSLHFNLANTDLKPAGIGSRDVSIPVKEILPPGFTKSQTATQGSSVVWSVRKSSTPADTTFTETCPPSANPQSVPVTVTVTWTKQTASAGDITVQAVITVTNNAHRPIDVSVSDQLYTGATPASGNEVGTPHVTNLTDLEGTESFTDTFTVPAGTATVFSDRATATFKDTFFQETLGTATATASSTVTTLPPSSGATAVITDVETMTGDTAYDFTVDSVTGVAGSFSGYTLGSHTRGPVSWSSGTQSNSGSTTFNKTVYVNAPTTGTATLADTATITPAGQTATSANASSTFNSNATVSLTINKTIPVVLDSNDATQTFTFPVSGPGGAVSPSPTISFGPGDGGVLNPKSVTLTGLAPGSYTVNETTLAPYQAQSPQAVNLSLPTCSGATTFTNNFGPATAAARKVTVPAGGEAGWQFTLKRNGVLLDSGTTNSSGDLIWASNGSTTIQLVDEGSYVFEEVVKPGWDQDASGTSGCSFTVDYPADADEAFVCTFRNVQRGRIIVDKVTQPANDPQLFTFNPSWSTTDFQLADQTAPHDSGLLQPGSYNVSEAVPADWQLISSTCTDLAGNTYSPSNITLLAGQTVTCTFTNRKFGHVRVVKTVNGGAIQSGQSFTFQIRSGATSSNVGTVLESKTITSSTPGGAATFSYDLVPGQTYQLCEAELPVGWHSSLSDQAGAFVPGGIDNSTVCVNFTVAAGELKIFTVDNTPPPGGDARTIGYWKTHASCSTTGAKKRPKLDQTLASAEPDGIRIGDLVLHGSTSTPNVAPDCLKAVRILNKSRIDNGAKMASDPAFNLAAQLLAAKLNIEADAGTCAAANTAISQGQALLDAINFNGVTHLTMTSTQKTQANALASTLDRYNNNTLC